MLFKKTKRRVGILGKHAYRKLSKDEVGVPETKSQKIEAGKCVSILDAPTAISSMC